MTAGSRERPFVLLSRCLLSDDCRYDGTRLPHPLPDEILTAVDHATICPEMSIGLGVPRDPIRIRRNGGKHQLVQPATGRDLTADMERFIDGHLATLDPARVDGFILKSRSPSCALTDAKIYDGDTPIGTGPGLFGAAIMRRFPGHPVADETDLADPEKRRDFMARLFRSATKRSIPERSE